MKRELVLLTLLLLVLSMAAVAGPNGHDGPAPNAGDCIPDGSGFDAPAGPSSGGIGDAFGTAPASGDGIPDGSGMTPPNSPNG